LNTVHIPCVKQMNTMLIQTYAQQYFEVILLQDIPLLVSATHLAIFREVQKEYNYNYKSFITAPLLQIIK